MKSLKFLPLILTLILLSCGGEGPKPPKVSNSNVSYDTSPFYVEGILKFNNDIIKVDDVVSTEYLAGVNGKINFEDLQRVILYDCQDILEKQGIPGDFSCSNTTVTNPGGDICTEPVGNFNYKSDICSELIYMCAGYKNLEIAENISNFKIENFAVQYLTDQFLPFSENSTFKKGIFCDPKLVKFAPSQEFAPVDTNDSTTGTCFNTGVAADCHYSISLGPQKPHVKTWLYRAALDAFERAGINASRVLRSSAGRTYILDNTRNRKFVIEFGEIIERYLETAEKLTKNQLEVASVNSMTAYPDQGKLSLWGDPNNSRSSAMKILFGKEANTVENGVDTLCPACTNEAKSSSVKKAVDFLRTARPAKIFTPGTTALQILTDAKTILNLTIDNDRLFSAHQFNLNDIELARRYLIDEASAYRRINSVIDGSVPERLTDLSVPVDLPTSYYQASVQSLNGNFTTSSLYQSPSTEISAEDYFIVTDNSIIQPQRSAHEFISFMRDSALLALKNAGTVTPEVKNIYGRMAALGANFAGKDKLFIERTFTSAFKLVLKGNVQDGDNLNFVKDTTDDFSVPLSGLNCFLYGKVGGQPCNEEQKSAFLDADKVAPIYSEQDSPFDSVTMKQYSKILSKSSGAISSGTFHIFHERGGVYTYLSSINLTNPTTLNGFYDVFAVGEILELPIGGEIHSQGKKIISRDAGECGEPAVHCTGLRADIVPALENEMISDGNMYENSWSFYLNQAKQSAEKADNLGRLLIEAGLSMDVKTEEAALSLTEICGTVVNPTDEVFGDASCTSQAPCSSFDQYISSNPTLEECLPQPGDTVEMASLGPKVSLWKFKPTGGTEGDFCVCPEGNEEICPKNCPIFSEFEGEFDSEKVIFTPIERTLNIVTVDQASSETTKDMENVLTCEEISSFRKKHQAGTTTYAQNQAFWQRLDVSGYTTPNLYIDILDRVRVDNDPFFHYKLFINNSLYASTYKAQDGCPRKVIWRNPDETNQPINCEVCNNITTLGTFKCSGSDLNIPTQTWVAAELDGPVQNRVLWGSRLIDVMKTMSLFGKTLKGFGYSFPSSGIANNPQNDAEYIGYDYNPFPDKAGVTHAIDPDGRRCIFEHGFSWPQDGVSGTSRIAHYLNFYNCDLSFEVNGCFVQRYEAGYAIGSSFNQCGFFYDDYRVFKGNNFHSQDYDSIGEFLFYPGGKVHDIIFNNSMPGEVIDTTNDVRSTSCDNPVAWIELAKPNTSQGYYPLYHYKPICLDADRVFDALEFACFIKESTELSCSSLDVDWSTYNFSNATDLDKVRKRVDCIASGIKENVARMVVFNAPEAVVKKHESGSETFGKPKGLLLAAYTKIDNTLIELSSSISSISDTLKLVSSSIQTTKLQIAEIEIQGEIASIRSAQATLQNYMGMLGALQDCFKPSESASFAPTGLKVQAPYMSAINIAFNSAKIAMYEKLNRLESEIKSLNAQATDLKIDQAVQTFIQTLTNHTANLRMTFETIEKKLNELNLAFEELRALKKKAEVLAARAAMAGSDSAGQVYPTNTVMRKRYNTLRIQYENALKMAKKNAFIARRAIEFRLGMDLRGIDQSMLTVEAPSTWADDLCTIDGINYAEIRQETEDSSALMDYSKESIGDYVDKLTAFTVSYINDFPFSDGNDTAVISIRDDLLKTRSICTTNSYNLIYNSGNLTPYTQDASELETTDTYGKWEVLNCPDNSTSCLSIARDGTEHSDVPESISGIVNEGTFPVSIKDAWKISDRSYSISLDASETLIMTPYDAGTEFTGYLKQTIPDVKSGKYVFSFWYKKDSNNTFFKFHVNYGSGTSSETLSAGETWNKKIVEIDITGDSDVEIQIHPSTENSTNTGGILIWGLQLEKYVEANKSRGFQSTDDTRTITVLDCPDTTGTELRSKFTRKCTCHHSIDCDESSSDYYCFFELSFPIDMEQVENGEYLTSGAISNGNFNYRHNSIAVNLIGTNVISCEDSNTYNCYTNGFINYTLLHDGTVKVRNHTGDAREFNMSQAVISSAKALSAEVVVTYPLSSNHQSMVSQVEKTEFKGRPLQGIYTLRIHENPNFRWENLEDIQLIWKYHYWTRQYNNY